jgi:hypothetical protein
VKGLLSSGASVKSVLFPGTTVSDDQANAMFSDPNWGFNNMQNYIRWDALTYGTDPVM